MFEHSVYTVASPEACAAILWKDAKKSPQAAAALKITSGDLKQLGLIDRILPEPPSGAHSEPLEAAETLKQAIWENIEELFEMTPQQRQQLRYEKFRKMGVFEEAS